MHTCTPAQKLRNALCYWHHMGASRFLLSMIIDGARLPFVNEEVARERLLRRQFHNPVMTEIDILALNSLVDHYLQKGYHILVTSQEAHQGTILPCFPVPKKNRDLSQLPPYPQLYTVHRFVSDGRPVNQYLQQLSCRYDDLRQVEQILLQSRPDQSHITRDGSTSSRSLGILMGHRGCVFCLGDSSRPSEIFV